MIRDAAFRVIVADFAGGCALLPIVCIAQPPESIWQSVRESAEMEIHPSSEPFGEQVDRSFALAANIRAHVEQPADLPGSKHGLCQAAAKPWMHATHRERHQGHERAAMVKIQRER